MVYIKSVIVYLPSLQQHTVDVSLVFERLRNANLRVKPSKRTFVADEVSFLGYIVKGDGVKTDSKQSQIVG